MTNHHHLPIAPPAAPAARVESAPPSVDDLHATAEGLMQVGDLARVSGKTVRAIHLYEELGLLNPAARSKGRFRLYSQEALVRVRWLSKLQDLGFSLSDIQAVARDFDRTVDDASPSAAMARLRDLYLTKLQETRAQIHRLRALEHEIVASLDYLETCQVCDPQRVVSACRSCNQHDCGQEPPELVAGFQTKSL